MIYMAWSSDCSNIEPPGAEDRLRPPSYSPTRLFLMLLWPMFMPPPVVETKRACTCSKRFRTFSMLGLNLRSRTSIYFMKSMRQTLLLILSSRSCVNRASLGLVTRKWNCRQSDVQNKYSPVKSSQRRQPALHTSERRLVPTYFLLSYFSVSFLVFIVSCSISGDLQKSVPRFL